MKLAITILQWLILAAVVFSLAFYWGKISLPHFNLSSFEIIFIALSIAFMWVEVFKLGVTKPFTCLHCMTGWISLIIGCLVVGWWGIVYLPIGLFVGSIFSAIQMRWL